MCAFYNDRVLFIMSQNQKWIVVNAIIKSNFTFLFLELLFKCKDFIADYFQKIRFNRSSYYEFLLIAGRYFVDRINRSAYPNPHGNYCRESCCETQYKQRRLWQVRPAVPAEVESWSVKLDIINIYTKLWVWVTWVKGVKGYKIKEVIE